MMKNWQPFQPSGWGGTLAGAAVVFFACQPRIFFSMARDGLLPSTFARVHPVYRTPHITSIATGLAVGLRSGVASIDEILPRSPGPRRP